MDAEVYEGVKQTLKYLLNNKVNVKIIRHKTQYPYLGEKVDFRLSAMNWSNKKILSEISSKNFSEKDIFLKIQLVKK